MVLPQFRSLYSFVIWKGVGDVKTFLEQKFEKAIVKFILSHCYPKEMEEDLVSQFYANGHTYYHQLCDALYAVSTGQNMKPLWITPKGQIYLDLYSRHNSDRILAFPDEIPPFSLDLVNQLDYVINKI